jgi:hypothetical protein
VFLAYRTGAVVRVKAAELLLHYRLRWPSRGYVVRVSMHYLPGAAVLRSKYARSPQSHGEASSLPPTFVLNRSSSTM